MPSLLAWMPTRPSLRERRIPALCAVLLLALLAGVHAKFRLTLVAGESMLPTYATGDLLVVDKTAYHHHGPERGDIVLIRDRHGLMVKRIVGLPGEEIALRRGILTVNGRRLPITHPVALGPLSLGSGYLLDGRFAVLGDNRDLSPSQKVHAVVGTHQILGKVIASVQWPRRTVPAEDRAMPLRTADARPDPPGRRPSFGS